MGVHDGVGGTGHRVVGSMLDQSAGRAETGNRAGALEAASAPTDLSIVMVTQPSQRARAILAALAGRRLGVNAVVLDQGSLRGGDVVERTRRVWRRTGAAETSRRIRRRVRRTVTHGRRRRARDEQRYGAFAPLHVVRDVNAERTRRLLTELGPDLIVLGSSRILEPHIIDIPSIGVLNAHPGLLPAYRGVDVIAWAVRNGDPLGVTIHWVDVGIDTGAIVAQRRFEPAPGDTLASLRRRADAVAGELMADVVGRLCLGDPLPATPQEPGAGRLYPRMTPSQRRQVDQTLRTRWRHHR